MFLFSLQQKDKKKRERKLTMAQNSPFQFALFNWVQGRINLISFTRFEIVEYRGHLSFLSSLEWRNFPTAN